MESYDLSIDALEKIADKYGFALSDDLIGLVSDVIVMVMNDTNKGEKYEWCYVFNDSTCGASLLCIMGFL